MAETALGMGPHGRAPEWAQFDFNFSQEQLNGEFDLPSEDAQSPLQQHNYDLFNPDVQPTLFHSHQQALPPQAFQKAFADIDREDNAANARFAHEQIANLDSSNPSMSQPKGEHRKGLAEKLGLDLLRANNRWQRAKSQRHLGSSGSDGLSKSGPRLDGSGSLSMPPSDALCSSSAFAGPSAQDIPRATRNFGQESSRSHPHQALHHHSAHSSHATGFAIDSSSFEGSSIFPHHAPGASEWMSDLNSISLSEALGRPGIAHSGASPPVSHSLPSSHGYPADISGVGGDFMGPSPLNPKASRSGLMGNGSTQTLVSSTSSLADGSTLMTPPESGPLMPWLSSELDTRRTSDSSELAHTVEGMHLQQGPPSLGLITTGLAPSPHSSMVSANGIATPDASPEQLTGKIYGPPSDLASRRKRIRPAALRPEKNRSASSNEYSSRSPHSRNSSVGVGPPGAPRRTQSSGQVLHNNFRVHKSGNHPTQVSPRNLQPHFDKQNHRKSAANSANASPTTPHDTSNKPSTSAASANRSPAEYQHEFHVRSASASHCKDEMFQMPRHANSSVPNLHSSSSPSHGPLSIQVPSHDNPQIPFHNPNPQSAPPYQTTFFGDSPPHGHGPFPPPFSHGHPFAASQPGEMALGAAPGQQPTHFMPPPSNGYLPPFAPQYTFPETSAMAGYPSHGFVPGFGPGSYELTPAPAVELDIKVELGPEPKLSSRFDKCEFQHTFSNSWAQTGNKK